jgi:hypothetical protein
LLTAILISTRSGFRVALGFNPTAHPTAPGTCMDTFTIVLREDFQTHLQISPSNTDTMYEVESIYHNLYKVHAIIEIIGVKIEKKFAAVVPALL